MVQECLGGENGVESTKGTSRPRGHRATAQGAGAQAGAARSDVAALIQAPFPTHFARSP